MIKDALNKLFVRVPVNTYADHNIAAIVTASQQTGNTGKIYFVEDTNEIVVNGVKYGANPSTLESISDLQALIGRNKLAQEGADSATIISRLVALEAIHVNNNSANYMSVTDSDNAVTTTPELGLTIVPAIENLTANDATGLVDAKNVKAYIDSQSAKATSKVVADNVGVVVNASVNDDQSVTYKIANDLRLRYVAATTGADADQAHIDLYCEHDTSIFGRVNVADIIGNGLLQSTNYNPSTGELTLTFAQADGTSKTETIDLHEMLDINDMSVKNDSSLYLKVTLDHTASEDGKSQAVFETLMQDVSTSAANATGLADAWNVKQYVDSKTTDLAVSASGDDYVAAAVDANNNKHINVISNVQNVTADAGTRGTWAVTDAGVASLTGEVAPSMSGVANSLVDGADVASKVKTYVDAKVAAENADAAAHIEAAVKALDANVTSDDDTNVIVNVVEVDGKLTDVAVNTAYGTFTRTAHAENVNADFTLAAGDGGKLVKAQDVLDAYTTAVEKLNEAIASLTDSLDSSVNATDTKGFVSYEVEQTNGLLSDASLNVTYGNFKPATGADVVNGLTTVEDVKDFVDTYDFWETYSA